MHLRIDQGATLRKRFVWRSGPLAAPVDLTGYSARMQIRSSAASATVLASLTTADASITLGGTAGTIDLHITAAQTAAFTWTTGVWDLELESPTGDVRRLLSGTAEVTPEVTR